MIAPGIKYLIKSINEILASNEDTNYVSTSVDMYKDKEAMNTKIDFNYLLHIDGTNPKIIAITTVAVDPEYYILHKEEILAKLNDMFFKQILLHTNFQDIPNIINLQDTWRQN